MEAMRYALGLIQELVYVVFGSSIASAHSKRTLALVSGRRACCRAPGVPGGTCTAETKLRLKAIFYCLEFLVETTN